MKKETKAVVFTAILVAITILFGVTSIGYIPLPFAKLTLLCIPTIVGTLTLGLKTGMGLSVVFILTSILQMLIMPSQLILVMLNENALLTVLCLIIPRLLIAPLTYGIKMLFEKTSKKGGLIVASAAGSLINTFVFLIWTQIFFVSAISTGFQVDIAGATGIIWGIVLTNGLPEAALAAIICPAIVMAINKSGFLKKERRVSL